MPQRHIPVLSAPFRKQGVEDRQQLNRRAIPAGTKVPTNTKSAEQATAEMRPVLLHLLQNMLQDRPLQSMDPAGSLQQLTSQIDEESISKQLQMIGEGTRVIDPDLLQRLQRLDQWLGAGKLMKGEWK